MDFEREWSHSLKEPMRFACPSEEQTAIAAGKQFL